MLPRKLRTPKIQEKIIDPQGVARWQAGIVARGILNTTAKWIEGKEQVTLDRLDIVLLAKSKEHLHESAPIIGYNPFQSIASGMIEVTIRTAELRQLLGL